MLRLQCWADVYYCGGDSPAVGDLHVVEDCYKKIFDYKGEKVRRVIWFRMVWRSGLTGSFVGVGVAGNH